MLEPILGVADGDAAVRRRAARRATGRHGSKPRKRGAAGAAHRASAWGQGRLLVVTCSLAARVRALNIALARHCVHVHVVMGPAKRMICCRCT